MTPEERMRMDAYERRTEALAELAKTQDKRLDESERRIELLIGLASTQNSRMNEYERLMGGIAQALNDLVEAQKELTESQKELREAQKQTEAHLSVLSTIVEELGRAERRTEEKLAETDEQLRALAATVDRHIESKGGQQ